MGGNDSESAADDRLPPSSRYVLDVLDRADGELSRQTLLEETELPERTLDRALDRLESAGKIRQDRDTGDLRQKVAIMASM